MIVACPLTFCPPVCGILLPTKAIHHKTEGIVVKKNLTELVFILDRSGSMGGLEQDTIGAEWKERIEADFQKRHHR